MAASKIPVWIKQCLDQYGNCACGRAITKKIGKENLLQILENEGDPCELQILSDQKDKSAYPKDGTYILTLKNRQSLMVDEDEDEEKILRLLYYKFLIISSVNASVEALPPRSKVHTFLSSNVLFNAFRIFVATLS